MHLELAGMLLWKKQYNFTSDQRQASLMKFFGAGRCEASSSQSIVKMWILMLKFVSHHQSIEVYQIIWYWSLLASEVLLYVWKVWRKEQTVCLLNLPWRHHTSSAMQSGSCSSGRDEDYQVFLSTSIKKLTCNQMNSSNVSTFLEQKILKLFQSEKSLCYMQLYVLVA